MPSGESRPHLGGLTQQVPLSVENPEVGGWTPRCISTWQGGRKGGPEGVPPSPFSGVAAPCGKRFMKYVPKFAALCPHCRHETDQGTFQRHALREFLDERTLRFYCRHCEVEWRSNDEKLAGVERVLSQPLTLAESL
jgi:hypothetical protein